MSRVREFSLTFAILDVVAAQRVHRDGSRVFPARITAPPKYAGQERLITLRRDRSVFLGPNRATPSTPSPEPE